MNVDIQYYAVFEYADDGINITFPDIPEALSCAFSKNQAIKMSEDALVLALEGRRKCELPKPSKRDEIGLLPNTEIIDVKITMREHEERLFL